MRVLRVFLALILAFVGLQLGPSVAATKSTQFTANVWADNWFELYVNGKRIGQDSVSITTERSFNAETFSFTATYPLTIGFVVKDYVENKSGLEYIGKPNQQIGDGGAILQIFETKTRRLVTATDKTWRAFVTYSAPTNPTCVTSTNPLVECSAAVRATPKTWLTSLFNATNWPFATEYSESEVGVKEGYLGIDWHASAKLVWSKDLKLDNTILLRKRISAPLVSQTSASTSKFVIDSALFPNGQLPVTSTCDGAGSSPDLGWSVPPTGTISQVVIMDGEPGPPRAGEVVGPHYYWVLYNIPPSSRHIPPGVPGRGTLGMNFKDRLPGYTPPCSQGPGEKLYRIRVFAVSKSLDLPAASATGAAVLTAIEGHVLATAELQVKYTRS